VIVISRELADRVRCDADNLAGWFYVPSTLRLTDDAETESFVAELLTALGQPLTEESP